MGRKFLIRRTRITLVVVLLLSIIGHVTWSAPAPNSGVTIKSPNGRYVVRFSEQRSDNVAGDLWGKVTVRDLRTGRRLIGRVAEGQRGRGVFEGFSPSEQSNAWSPDGLYLAYWDNQCQDEPAVPGGAICHLHEIRFLSLQRPAACREGLVLGRYAFAGWVRDRPHTVLENLVNEDGQSVSRQPCIDAKY
jgi:hypothetical protein